MGLKYCNSACSSLPCSGEPSTLVSSTAVYDSSSLQKTKTHVTEDMAVAIENVIVKNTRRLLKTSESNCLLEKKRAFAAQLGSKICKI